VKHIAFQEKVGVEELDSIPGSGSDGRLTKDDLLNYLRIRDKKKAAADAPPTSPAGYEIGVEVTPVIGMPPKPVEPEIQNEPEAESAVAEQIETKPTPAAESAQQQTSRPSVGQAPTSSVSGADEIIEMDRMRRLIAEHMVMSKHTSPHVTSFVEADVTGLVMWRDKIKNSFEKREGEKITFTPIFMEAVVKAIKDFPLINSSVNGTQIVRKAAINISMATALPNGNLIVPVIKQADQLNLLGLTKAVNGLATKARLNKLLPDDVKDGTFTITNVGTFGNLMGTPIINQPQVAILAIGAIKKKPAVIETPEGDVIGIRHMMFLSLSYDHRVVDGALGGSFVKRVADYLENWDPNRDV
jgi:2-oxoglutarate dehydrogenase E2 component (dihydrolipoamide succinyltransferase)